MNAVVVYESIYGNTRAIGDAIAQGLGGARVVPVHEAAGAIGSADLLVVGGPTHMHGLASGRSRRIGVEAAEREGARTTIEPGASEEPGLRDWLGGLPAAGSARAAAFDTRLPGSPLLTGAAAHGIARRLRRHGYDVLGAESFLVADAKGPLAAGELARARAWGEQLAGRIAAAR